MKKLVLICFSILAGISSSAFAADSEIEGYATACSMHMAGQPVYRIDLYEKSADAIAEGNNAGHKVAPPKTVILDLGPGYQIADIYPQSKIREICLALQHSDGTKKITVTQNERGTLLSFTMDGKTIKSDAYMLMPKEQQDLVKALVRAYLQENSKAYYCNKAKTDATQPAQQEGGQ